MNKLEELKQEYESQDNRCTAYPIYVMVQELVCIGVIADGYSVSCPYGDGETISKFTPKDCDCESPQCDTEDEVRKIMKERGCDDSETMEVEEFQLGYIWHPVEFFLTIKGAKEYMEANKHNHGRLRTYVSHFEQRNFEMRALLKEIGFKTKE